MTKLAYLDCQTGIAGDMFLGALVAVGVPLDYLVDKLDNLGIEEEYQLWAEPVHRNGQLATKVHVDLLGEPQPPDSDHPSPNTLDLSLKRADSHHHHHPHPHPRDHHAPTRHLPDIEQLITTANLPPRVVDWSLSVFRNLAVAEGAVHGIAPEAVHFHEVGATDALVDIVGTCLGLDWLGIDQLYCSALPVGSGTVWAAHGRLPVPVPAVLKLWESRQVPVYSNGLEGELVTPTGAALVVTLAKEFGHPPPMHLQQVGQGAGSRELPLPNMVRLWLGDALPGTSYQPALIHQDASQETVCVLETQIDDLSPQAIGYVFEVLFKAGALDVFTQGIGMKKCRPGVLLTVICPPSQLTVCEDILFRETTTLGIRHIIQQRTILQREIQEVQTPYGVVRVKVARRPDAGDNPITNVQPEYDDCAAIARQQQLSWREVHQMVVERWHQQQGSIIR